MTAQIIPFAEMQNMNPALFKEMLQKMATLQQEQRAQKEHTPQNWRNLTQKSEQSADPMLGMLFGMMLFGGLFPSAPAFDFGVMTNMIQGLSQLGVMRMAEGIDNPLTQLVPQMGIMDRLFGVNNDLTTLNMLMQSSDSQNNNLLILALLMKIMQNGQKEGDASGSGGEMIAMDAFRRHPIKARFKQNSHSALPLKTLLPNQKNDMFAAKANHSQKLAL